MRSLKRVIGVGGVAAAALVIGTASSASAKQTFQECVDQAENHNGEPPTCTKVNGSWVASWPDDGGMGSGGFAFLFVLAAIVGMAVLVWKVSIARQLATSSGMNPDVATGMTLLTDNGLEATYLAANLRGQGGASAATPPGQATAAKRLADLKGLLDQGLITEAEYDDKRRAIIDAV